MKSIRILVLIIFSVFTTSILANSCETFQTGDWSDQNTWTACGGMIPQDDDSVLIKINHTVLLNQDTSQISALDVEVGGGFNVTSSGFILNANLSGADIDLSNASIELEGFLSIDANAHNILLGAVDGGFGLSLNSSAETRLFDTIGGTTPLMVVQHH